MAFKYSLYPTPITDVPRKPTEKENKTHYTVSIDRFPKSGECEAERQSSSSLIEPMAVDNLLEEQQRMSTPMLR